jgi:protein associated with RNAse G/E
MDLMLDVVVEPDLTWRWKDKEEFEEIVERGIFDEALGRRIRDEADAVIESIESERSVFSESWPSWRPDPTWELPVLSSGWNTPATTLTP